MPSCLKSATICSATVCNTFPLPQADNDFRHALRVSEFGDNPYKLEVYRFYLFGMLNTVTPIKANYTKFSLLCTKMIVITHTVIALNGGCRNCINGGW